jgi:signal transduction histidine kinase
VAESSRRRSLHLRLAGWMIVSTFATLALYSAVLYVSFRIEELDTPSNDASGVEPLASEAREQMLWAMSIAGPLALLFSTGGALWLSRNALAPLSQVIAGARRVTTSDLSGRLAVPRRRDEIFDLVVEMNALFTRLEAGLGALARHAAEASHELRTPLAVVITQLEVALRHPRSTLDWEQSASAVLGELRRMSQLVEGLLALAHADAPLQREIFDLRERVDLVLVSLSARARDRQLALSAAAEGDGGDARLVGDPDALEMAIRNLVENAIRYTPRGGRIRVALSLRSEHVDVVVDDSGPGVPVPERKGIFQPLKRGSARAAEERGHGLGLAIVQRVVQHHAGSVHVDSSPNGGARFVLRLPRPVTPPG